MHGGEEAGGEHGIVQRGGNVLTVAQAALRAAVSDSLIYAWCADGTLPHTRVGRKGKRGHIRIAAEDLDALMASFKVEAKPAHLHLNHIQL